MTNTDKARTVKLVQDVQKSMKEAVDSAREEGYPQDIQTNLSKINEEFSRIGATIQSSNPTSHR